MKIHGLSGHNINVQRKKECISKYYKLIIYLKNSITQISDTQQPNLMPLNPALVAKAMSSCWVLSFPPRFFESSYSNQDEWCSSQNCYSQAQLEELPPQQLRFHHLGQHCTNFSTASSSIHHSNHEVSTKTSSNYSIICLELIRFFFFLLQQNIFIVKEFL